MFLFKKLLKYLAFNKGKCIGLYKRFCKPSTYEYADLLRSQRKLHYLGQNCSINLDVNITDPALVSIGSNVVLSDCHLIGHDGVVAMLNNAYNVKLDSVGKIIINDNVFIGHGAIVLGNVTIGPNSVVAAGALVNKDVPPGAIVGGVPAKPIGETEKLKDKLLKQTQSLPWVDLINQREGAFDPNLEGALTVKRVEYFFSKKNGSIGN